MKIHVDEPVEGAVQHRPVPQEDVNNMRNSIFSTETKDEKDTKQPTMQPTMLPTSDMRIAQPELPPSIKGFWFHALRTEPDKNTFLSDYRGNRSYLSIRLAIIVVAVGTALMPLHAISHSNAWWKEDQEDILLDCEKRQYFTVVAYNGVLAFFWADHLGAFLVRNLYYFDWSHLARVFSLLLGEEDKVGGHKIGPKAQITTIKELIFWHAILKRLVRQMNEYVNEWVVSWVLHMLLLHVAVLSVAFLVVSGHKYATLLPRDPCQLSSPDHPKPTPTLNTTPRESPSSSCFGLASKLITAGTCVTQRSTQRTSPQLR